MNEAQARYLVNTYADMILRISYHYFNQTCDAEDICQTVFLKYFSEPRKFKSSEHEKAWLIRTTINVCKDLLKSPARRRTVSLEDAPQLSAPQEPANELLDAVKRLPETYRLAIYLYYYEKYSTKEIGTLLGKQENTVCAYLSRGRKMLKKMLTNDLEGGFPVENSV